MTTTLSDRITAELDCLETQASSPPMGRLLALNVKTEVTDYSIDFEGDRIEHIVVSVDMTARYEDNIGGETLIAGAYSRLGTDDAPDWRIEVDYSEAWPKVCISSIVQWLEDARIDRGDIRRAMEAIATEDTWVASSNLIHIREGLGQLLAHMDRITPVFLGPDTPTVIRAGGESYAVAVIEGLRFTPTQLAKILVACDPVGAMDLVAQHLNSQPAPAHGGF